MSFRTLAVVTAVVTAVLGLAYLVAGAVMLGPWQIEPTVSVLLLSKRIGAIYLGLAVIFLLARSAPASAARTALCAGALAVTAGLAILSVSEFVAGHAGGGILVSAAVELLLAIGFFSVLLAERKVSATG